MSRVATRQGGVTGGGGCAVQVYVESLRTFHLSVAKELKISNDTVAEMEVLLDELKVGGDTAAPWVPSPGTHWTRRS